MNRPVIAFIGAGSTVFTKNLLGDLLSYEELSDCEIRLHDIDEKRLELSRLVALRVAQKLGVTPRVIATTSREQTIDGADYVLNTIQVAGYEPGTVRDFEIPRKYGLQQTIGDTVGIGGIMRALRTVPVMLEMVRDMERLCPDALHLNYVNPMAIVTWALNLASPVRTVGLCHSVQGTARELARDAGVPGDEVRYLAAGINHMSFFLELEHDGEDLYPRVRRVAEEGRAPAHNLVRYEMLRRLGYFVTESSEHFSEYVPWFIKRSRPELLARFNIPLDEYPGRCQTYEVAWRYIEAELSDPGSQNPEELRSALEGANIEVMQKSIDHLVEDFAGLNEVKRSIEYGASIIHAIETDRPSVVYGNVLNEGLITNLPEGCCVEVPCLVDGNGVQPTHVGTLPPQLAALMQTNVNVQSLTVEALLNSKREHVYHAAMLDPHTAAELPLEEIWQMVDELLEAHGEWIPEVLREPASSAEVA